ncbi:MAG: endonuclease/exonuclease/phosphatase family protein [Chloroflexi bacterium]|nr:endonuclease/exonuclease/phosphatase family protein [Chloroflexota bacterium]
MPRALVHLFELVSVIYLVALAGFMGLRLALPERWWVLFLANFMPFYFLPAFALLAPALLLRRYRLVLPLLVIAVGGLALFGSYFMPRAAAASSGFTLRLLTFNVSQSNRAPAQVEDWLRGQSYDVVFLQELTPAWAQRLARLRDRYPYQVTTPTMAVLSRFPLQTAADDLTAAAPFVKMRLAAIGHTVTLYNVSLPTPLRAEPRQRLPYVVEPAVTAVWDMSLSYDETRRDRGIEQLIRQLDAEQGYVIVAGDFNMSDQTAAYNRLASRLRDSFRQAGWGLGTSWPVFQVWGLPAVLPPLVRLDYIWTSDNIRTVQAWQGKYLGSDHLPLGAAIALSPS